MIARRRPEVRVKVCDDSKKVIDFAIVVFEISRVPLHQIAHAEDRVRSEQAEIQNGSFEMNKTPVITSRSIGEDREHAPIETG